MSTRQKHEPTARQSRAGFGLMSVIVAVLLLSVGILSLAPVLTQSTSMQTVMDLRTTALDIARSYMEEVRGTDPLMLTAQAEVRVNGRGEVDSNGIFTRELTVEAVDFHVVEATVIVTLPRSNPVILVTLIYDGVY